MQTWEQWEEASHRLDSKGPAVGSGLQWERKDSFGGHKIERALALELGFKFSSAFAGWLGQILPFSGPQSLFYTLRRSEGWSLRHLSTEKGCNSHPVKEGRGGRYSVARWQALWWFTYPEAVLGTSCHRWAGRCSIIPAIWMERCGDSHILAMIATRGIVMSLKRRVRCSIQSLGVHVSACEYVCVGEWVGVPVMVALCVDIGHCLCMRTCVHE